MFHQRIIQETPCQSQFFFQKIVIGNCHSNKVISHQHKSWKDSIFEPRENKPHEVQRIMRNTVNLPSDKTCLSCHSADHYGFVYTNDLTNSLDDFVTGASGRVTAAKVTSLGGHLQFLCNLNIALVTFTFSLPCSHMIKLTPKIFGDF